MRITCTKFIAWYLVIAMFIIGIAPKVEAGFIPSEIISPLNIDRTADLKKIQHLLETKAVSERLSQLGLTRDEIQTRIALLSDQQIHQLAVKLDDIRVGQDGPLGVIIALLVIAVLVVILLKLTGHKVIITK